MCVLKGWPHFHVDQWLGWNYVSALRDLEYNYPIGSIRSHLNVWFIADWWLVYFDLQFNSDLCMFIWTILTNPDFCKGIFYRQEMWLWTILSIVGILLKCKFSSFSTSINIRFIEETERGYTFNKKELPRCTFGVANIKNYLLCCAFPKIAMM